MTPELITTVLALPLPVRLALLDADPTGAGWLIPPDAETVANCYVVGYVSQHEHRRVRDGAAWLPSNPLAVIEVAARLLANRHGLPPSIELLGPDEDDGWTCRLVIARGVTVEAQGSRAEIGVRVLVGVVGHE